MVPKSILFMLVALLVWLNGSNRPVEADSVKIKQPTDSQLIADEARKYFTGDGVKQDYAQAAKLYRQAAEAGNAEGQNGLGACYLTGRGLKKDAREAVRWFKLAAAQDLEKAQLNLADCYWYGDGVTRNKAEAIKLILLATSVSNPSEDGSRTLNKYLNGSGGGDKELAWLAAKHTPTTKGQEVVLPPKPSLHGGAVVDGSGFFISPDGWFVTCQHVIDQTTSVYLVLEDGFIAADVVALDAKHDLALLKVDKHMPWVPLGDSRTAQLGQTVFTVGFPNIDLQGINPKLTKGEINALSGMQDRPDQFQISVPVQPGNSGGVLADAEGRVIGIVIAQLDTLEMLESGRAPPQNVNYAVKIEYLDKLLQAAGKLHLRQVYKGGHDTAFEETVKRVEPACAMVLAAKGSD